MALVRLEELCKFLFSGSHILHNPCLNQQNGGGATHLAVQLARVQLESTARAPRGYYWGLINRSSLELLSVTLTKFKITISHPTARVGAVEIKSHAAPAVILLAS